MACAVGAMSAEKFERAIHASSAGLYCRERAGETSNTAFREGGTLGPLLAGPETQDSLPLSNVSLIMGRSSEDAFDAIIICLNSMLHGLDTRHSPAKGYKINRGNS